MESSFVLFCTCPDEKTARSLAGGLVEKRLAACVNVVPVVRSIYRWEGAIQDDAEALMIVKTSASCYQRVEHWIARHHPYDVPEIIAIAVGKGLPAYLEWLIQETKNENDK